MNTIQPFDGNQNNHFREENQEKATIDDRKKWES